MALWDLDQLATNKMLAARYKVSPGAVINWRHRYDDCPGPVHDFSGTPVYDTVAYDAWYAIHITYQAVIGSTPHLKPSSD